MIKKGLFRRLKNIKNENEELLKAKNKTENIKEVTDFVDQSLNLGAQRNQSHTKRLWLQKIKY